MALNVARAWFALALVALVELSVAMRSSVVSLHTANEQETVINGVQTLSSTALNTSLPEFPCPEACSECCASDSWFGGSKKFKCVLKKAYQFPRGRICTDRKQRASSPGQYKAECELTQLEIEMYQQPRKCSKKATCCCSKDKMKLVHRYEYSLNRAVCARNNGKNQKVRHEHEGRSVYEILTMVEDTPTEPILGMSHTCAGFGDLVRYHREVEVFGGQCLTDLKGLEAVGEKYECPENMFETDPNSVESIVYGNTKCICDDDC